MIVNSEYGKKEKKPWGIRSSDEDTDEDDWVLYNNQLVEN
jgi:hypothetical protein